MPKVTLLLWDVGGVLLSNAWDRAARTAAATQFGLDASELERRHQLVDAAFETGRLDRAGYLAATVFYEPRSFSAAQFWEFMRGRSSAIAPTLELAQRLRAEGPWFMAVLNNESSDLNEYRIATFGLGSVFHAFFSSCYTGRRKPEPEAYRYALTITQRTPEESVFIDDRPENVSAASRLGLRTILVRSPDQLREELALAGVAPG